jgi:signal transduction histidine kinase
LPAFNESDHKRPFRPKAAKAVNLAQTNNTTGEEKPGPASLAGKKPSEESYDPDLKPLLFLALPKLRKTVGYTSLMVYNSQGQPLQPDQFIRAITRHFFRFPGNRACQETEELLVQLSLSQPEPLAIEDFQDVIGFNQDERAGEKKPPARLSSEVRAWCSLPLISREHLIGVVVLRHNRRGFFSPEKVQQAWLVVNQTATTQSRLWAQAQTTGVLKERQRIARELHDSVTQVFYGIELGINTALTLLERNSAQVKPQLQEVLALAEAGLAEMRALLIELHPAALETQGLVPNLIKQVEILQVRYGLEVSYNLAREPDISIQFKEALYRITQEAFNNVVRHAQATRVELNLFQDDKSIRLEVKDNGCGFDPAVQRPGHLGQQTMRERAEELGGKVEILTARGAGTLVRVFLPLPPPE